jgi:hypothetical protein
MLVRLWRERPRLLPMVRLLSTRRRPGAPAANRRGVRATHNRVATLRGPITAAETIALVAARPQSEQRLVVEWPQGEPGFEDWHRAVIAAGALPYLDLG